jgi:hypothetical protein
MKRTHFRPRPAFVVAVLALFIALGGGAYAATSLPANSVGTTQLKDNAVISSKVKNHSLLAKDFKSGQLPRGPRGPRGPKGNTGAPGPGAVGFQGTIPPNNTATRVLLTTVFGDEVKAICDSDGKVSVEFGNQSSNATDTIEISGSTNSPDDTQQEPFYYFQPPHDGNGGAETYYYEGTGLFHDQTTGQVAQLSLAVVGTTDTGTSTCSYWGTVTPSQ